MDTSRAYRFELVEKQANKPQEFHILSDIQNNNVMLVENSAIGEAFTMTNDKAKVCSKLRGTGGGCAWSCAVDADKQRVKVFTDQLWATFHYTCR